jgi:hypothetical protein
LTLAERKGLRRYTRRLMIRSNRTAMKTDATAD